MNKKGLSQILYLIIAASVLMIAALSMVFMLDEGLSGIVGIGETADATQCETQIEQRCSGLDGGQVSAPSSCIVEDAGGEERRAAGVQYTLTEDEGEWRANCPGG